MVRNCAPVSGDAVLKSSREQTHCTLPFCLETATNAAEPVCPRTSIARIISPCDAYVCRHTSVKPPPYGAVIHRALLPVLDIPPLTFLMNRVRLK